MPFQPGQSGNPDGRRKEDAHVRALARKYTEQAVRTLGEIMVDAKEPSAARVTAANSLLDRGWGKPVQEITGADGAGLLSDIVIRVVKAEPQPVVDTPSDPIPPYGSWS